MKRKTEGKKEMSRKEYIRLVTSEEKGSKEN